MGRVGHKRLSRRAAGASLLAGTGALVLPAAASGLDVAGAAVRPSGRGLYINQGTAQNPDKLNGFVRLCTAFGVDTLVVDLYASGPEYEKSVEIIQRAGLNYLPRIVVFPEGGTVGMVRSKIYWDKRMRLVNRALELGAKRIQLDYVRYNIQRGPSPRHAQDILRVIQYFGEKIHARGATFEIDVFGEVATTPSPRIGQDLRLFRSHIDGVCPMVYPSHYWPTNVTWKMPYELVYRSIRGARKTLGAEGPALQAYIEMFNFRVPMKDAQRAEYIRRQAQGAIAAGADGWYAWSATNSYGLLFDLLAAYGRDFEVPELQGATAQGS